MATAELDEKSTTEEVEKYAEEVFAKVAKQTEKSDAQITSEHANNKPDKTPAESDQVADGKTSGDEPKPDSSENWLTDEVKAEASAYGIKEDQLSEFTSREELDRALRIFDNNAMAAGRKALTDEGEKKAETNGEQSKKEEPKTPREGRFEISLKDEFGNEFDEGFVSELKRMHDHYEDRFDALEQRFAEADARAEEQHFDRIVDSLGHKDLFGKTDEETAKQLEHRKELLTSVKAHILGMGEMGVNLPMSDALVGRVARMVFADEMKKKDIKNHTRKISQQSDSRQGGGQTRPQDPPENPRDEADRLYKEMLAET